MIARSVAILTASLALLASVACQSEPTTPPAPNPDTASTVADPDAGMTLTVAADHAELRTIDRIRVTITLTRPLASPVTLTEPDWIASGWTVIDRTDAPPLALSNDRIERNRAITLEPFLAGDYSVPPVSVSWGTESAPRGLTTSPIPIAVNSVLAPDDPGELDASVGTLPPKPDEPFNPILPAVTLALFLAAVLLVWRLTRPNRAAAPAPPDPIRELAHIAASTSPGQDPSEVHRLLEALPPAQRGAVRAEITRCERARFGPDDNDPIDVPAVARDALRRLEAAR